MKKIILLFSLVSTHVFAVGYGEHFTCIDDKTKDKVVTLYMTMNQYMRTGFCLEMFNEGERETQSEKDLLLDLSQTAIMNGHTLFSGATLIANCRTKAVEINLTDTSSLAGFSDIKVKASIVKDMPKKTWSLSITQESELLGNSSHKYDNLRCDFY